MIYLLLEMLCEESHLSPGAIKDTIFAGSGGGDGGGDGGGVVPAGNRAIIKSFRLRYLTRRFRFYLLHYLLK